MDEVLIGTVTHYFPHIDVAAIEVTADELRLGDTIRVLGHTSNFTQKVHSMEMDYTPIESAAVGDLVAIQVAERAREGDRVYRISAHTHVDTEPGTETPS